MMYNVLKLAALSAALAAAAVTLIDGRRTAPSPAKFLTDRLQTEVTPAAVPKGLTGGMATQPASSCTDTAWPYRDSCDRSGATSTKVLRVISPDRREPSRVVGLPHAQIAQR